MRILITADPELPVPPTLYGGIERIVASLAETLAAHGHEIALSAHRESSVSAGKIFAWPGSRSRDTLDTIRNIAALGRAVRDFRPDVLHSFSRLMYMLPLLPGALPKIMSYQREPTPAAARRALALARGTLCFTGCSEYISARGRRGGGDWTTIHNFVDVGRYLPTASVARDAPLVFLGRVESIKGPHLAIEAARRAGRRLLIAGNHSATPGEADYWSSRIEPEIGKDGIEYVGPIDDRQKNDLLGKAAALIVPVQWSEPFGIVFAEALACGTPVITCARGATPEIVTNGEVGFLADTVEDMAVAISLLDRIDRSACRRRAEERFSAEHAAYAYMELYTRCVTERRAPALRT